MLTYDGSNESLTARVECGPSNSLDLSLGEWPRLPFTARINHPSKLARYSSHGMAPVLVPLRPSSEHILIVRAPGARDRHGCHSTPFHRARYASKKGTWPLPPMLADFFSILLDRERVVLLKDS